MDNIEIQENLHEQELKQVSVIFGVEQFLEIWGLKHLGPTFREHNIDLFCLEHMTESDIQTLIPNIGDRIKFRYELQNYRKLNNTVESADFSTSSVLSDSPTSKRSKISLDGSSSIIDNNTATNINLSDIISNHGKGLYIMTYYANEKKLDSRCRANLVDIIIDHYIKTKNGMTKEDFIKVSEKITKIFPKEEKEIYYIPAYKHNGTYIPAKGKLIDKYNNVSREMRKIGLLPNRRHINESGRHSEEPSTASDSNSVPPEIQENHKLWLLNGKEPWHLVENKWSESYSLRNTYYANKAIENIHKIIDEWPALKLPLGYKLIEIDFFKLYPGKAELLFNKWPEFVNKVMPILNSKIKEKTDEKKLLEFLTNTNNLENEPRDLIILILLITLLPPTCKIPVKTTTSATKLTWKPTVSESRDSFLMQVKSVNDIQHVINDRKELLQSLGLTFQPVIIFIGSTTKPEEFIVLFDNIKYKFNSILKAVDITFKLQQVLNISYSSECSQIWQFLQKYFYDINTAWDKKLPCIVSLISDLK